MQITEGRMPFMGYETYYRVAGDLSGGKAPLVLLHGGPGSTHNYFEVLDDLAVLAREEFAKMEIFPDTYASMASKTMRRSLKREN